MVDIQQPEPEPAADAASSQVRTERGELSADLTGALETPLASDLGSQVAHRLGVG